MDTFRFDISNMAVEDYDVFISFKKHDEEGNYTEDWKMAKTLYRAFEERKMNTFFSDISVGKEGESRYEEGERIKHGKLEY